MDRLAFVGNKGMSGLSYLPLSDYQTNEYFDVDLINLGLDAQAVFDGQTETVLSELAIVGSSGGARPKALLYFKQGDFNQCKTYEEQGDESWLIKFTSQN
ncbi:type II toxin-antitoxin system HipA family toxin, partial [Klebsiella aerogenes]|nr:type II toxin-antitoxin system HipA family toxin [Klebsiella aerogenes]